MCLRADTALSAAANVSFWVAVGTEVCFLSHQLQWYEQLAFAILVSLFTYSFLLLGLHYWPSVPRIWCILTDSSPEIFVAFYSYNVFAVFVYVDLQRVTVNWLLLIQWKLVRHLCHIGYAGSVLSDIVRACICRIDLSFSRSLMLHILGVIES